MPGYFYMNEAVLLKASDVNKAFAGVQALRSASFELRAGEIHALVGENGAGKSTLIKIITGAVAADSGLLELNGQSIVAQLAAQGEVAWDLSDLSTARAFPRA